MQTQISVQSGQEPSPHCEQRRDWHKLPVNLYIRIESKGLCHLSHPVSLLQLVVAQVQSLQLRML